MKYEKYLTFDDPIPYKNFLINPAKMRDYYSFHEYITCLLLDKNSVPDINVISMSYLEYLLAVGFIERHLHVMLISLMKMVVTIKKDGKIIEVNEDEIEIAKDGRSIIVSGEKITSEDFDEIKKIILLQNEIDPVDENTAKEVREKLQEAEEYKLKKNGKKVCDLEDRLVAISTVTGFTIEYLYGLTIRKFNKYLQREDHIMHYKIFMIGKMSGNVEFKDENALKHWLADLTVKDKYKDSKFDYDEAQDKFGRKN